MIRYGSDNLFGDAINTMRREQALAPLPELTPAEREAERDATRRAEAGRLRLAHEAFLAAALKYDLGGGAVGYVRFLRGRCATGSESGAGTRLHIVSGSDAICGASAGRNSAGWSDTKSTRPATCPRCLARLYRMGGRLLPPAA